MKKKSFLVIAVLCLALLFTATIVACTGDGDTDETPGNTDVTPGGDDVTPGGDDVTPGGDDVTPGGDQPEEIFYTVTFDTQGGSEMPSVYIKAGTAIGAITDPLKQCQTFVGFSLNPGGGTFWNTETDPVTDNITLYAVWAAAHTWGEWQTVTAATCTDEGSQQRMCFVCGEEETQAISALGHNYAIIASDDTYHWKECCRCNSVSEKESHVYIDGLCECGEIETTTDSEFTFTELGNNQWSIAKYNGNRAYVKIPSMHNGGTVVAIGDEAFGGDTTMNLKLKSVVIPDSVTTIGEYAFCYCMGLTSVEIPDSVTTIGEGAFGGCIGLTSITIGEYVTAIGEYAFEACVKLVEIYNKSDLNIAAGSEEYGGIGLYVKNIYTEENESKLSRTDDGYIFYYDGTDAYLMGYCGDERALTLPDGFTAYDGTQINSYEIHQYAFFICEVLTSVEISDSVTTIGDSAFYGCTALQTVEIPDSVTTIGDSAFYGCAALQTVEIPDSVTTIGEGAFVMCIGLTSVTIGESVTMIGDSAFNGCHKLIEVYNKSKLEITAGSRDNGYIGYYAQNIYTNEGGSKLSHTDDGYIFYYNGSDGYLMSYCGDETELTLPDSFTTYDGTTVSSYGIYQYAFSNYVFPNYDLTSVDIPDSVTEIGNSAFAYCTSLTSVYYTGDIAGWCGITFEGYSSNPLSNGGNLYIDNQLVTGLVIPDTVTEIKAHAFDNCASLTSVTIGESVTTIGGYAFAYCSNLQQINWDAVAVNDFDYYDNVFYNSGTANGMTVTFGDRVQRIPSYAFYDCASLTSVTIGESVTTIGDSAFNGCHKLIEVYNKSKLEITAGSWDNGFVGYYAKNVYTDEGGSKLSYTDDGYIFYYDGTDAYLMGYYGDETELTLPDSFTAYDGSELNFYKIYQNAFYSCAGLISVTIPDSVTSIGSAAFRYCVELTSVLIPDSVMTIGDSAFYGCAGLISVAIPDSVITIGNNAFGACTGLTSVTIGESVTTIGDSAFHGCIGLTSVVISDSVTEIGNFVFQNCIGLTSLVIPDSVTKIGDCAFQNCTGLTSLVIPDSVTAIEYNAFEGCTQLLEIEKGVSYVDKWAVDFDDSVTEVTLRNDTVGIADNAFQACDNLISVLIPDSVMTIGDSAFDGCTGLASVVIPDSVTAIGNYAFGYCTGLTSVTIGESVTMIGDSAFNGCHKLIEVYNKSKLEITAGSWGNDFVGYYPKNVYTDEGGSKLINTEDGYLFYGDVNNAYLVGYYGDDTELTLPDSFTAYDGTIVNSYQLFQYTFYHCDGLTSVEIPDSVTTIGYSAFNGCVGLISVTIPDSVTTIGDSAFYGCTQAIKIENGVSYVDKWAVDFDNSVTEVTLRNDTVGVADSAFFGCYGLTTVVIPDSVKAIGGNAFARCYSLTAVTLEDTEGWQVSLNESFDEYTPLPAESLADPAMVAQYLKDYSDYRYYIRKV